jgi:hypothetical protein
MLSTASEPDHPASLRGTTRSRAVRQIRFDLNATIRHTSRPPGAGLVAIDVIVLQPLVALIAGILILVIPRLLNIIVAVYLIVVGIMGLWPHVLR